jgi:hypothetical protein
MIYMGLSSFPQGPLTWTEELIKDALATQALHGENLSSPQCWGSCIPKFITNRCCKKDTTLMTIIFTSLRDGNRPHRIVGLTQQGH